MCDSTLKFGNKLLPHKLKCSILSRAILVSEITTHKFIKTLFRHYLFHAWWRSSDYKIATMRETDSNEITFKYIYIYIYIYS